MRSASARLAMATGGAEGTSVKFVVIAAPVDSPDTTGRLKKCIQRRPNSDEHRVVIGRKVQHDIYSDGTGQFLNNNNVNDVR